MLKAAVAILLIILMSLAVLFLVKPKGDNQTETPTSGEVVETSQEDESYELLEQELNDAVSDISLEDIESSMLK